MAGHAITSAAVVKIVDNVSSAGQVTVRNDGTGTCAIAKDPQLSPTGADAFVLAANTEQDVWLREGDALYAECPSGQTATLSVI